MRFEIVTVTALAAFALNTTVATEALNTDETSLVRGVKQDPDRWRQTRDRLVVFFLSAPGCWETDLPETHRVVREMKQKLPEHYTNLHVKCVGVCAEDDFHKAASFLTQHGPWDEVSIGGAGYNEFYLRYRWAVSEKSGIPRVLIFKDQDIYDEKRGHGVAKRILVGDYLGADQIRKWMTDGFPLWRLGPWESEINQDAPSSQRAGFDGHWRVTKGDDPQLAVERLEFFVKLAAGGSPPEIRFLADGEQSLPVISSVILKTPSELTFKVTADGDTREANCVVSLDGRSLRLRISKHDKDALWSILRRVD